MCKNWTIRNGKFITNVRNRARKEEKNHFLFCARKKNNSNEYVNEQQLIDSE
jgi:hypothetical protein